LSLLAVKEISIPYLYRGTYMTASHVLGTIQALLLSAPRSPPYTTGDLHQMSGSLHAHASNCRGLGNPVALDLSHAAVLARKKHY
jgi:hypothetical protein